MESNLISIVIPTYNRVEMLKKVMDSYLIQDSVKEIIIIDDGSTDDTLSYIKMMRKIYPKVKYIRNVVNIGSPGSRNLGVKASSGDFILFGEDDVRLQDNYSSQLLKCMKRTGASIIGGRLIHLLQDESYEDSLKRSNKFDGEIINKSSLTGNYFKNTNIDIEVPWIHAIVLIKREVFDKVSFDRGYKGNAYREENDFCINAQKWDFKVFLCPHTQCFHLPRELGLSGGQHSKGIFVYKYWILKNNLRFLKKHYPFLKEELKLEKSIQKLMLSQFFYELGKMFTYFLRKYFPSLYTFFKSKAKLFNL